MELKKNNEVMRNVAAGQEKSRLHENNNMLLKFQLCTKLSSRKLWTTLLLILVLLILVLLRATMLMMKLLWATPGLCPGSLNMLKRNAIRIVTTDMD